MGEKERRDAFETAIRMFSEKKSIINNNKNMNKFSEQFKDINKAISKKDPLVKEFIGLHRDAEKKKYTNLGRLTAEMKKVAAKQEIFLMAAELCETKEEKQSLIAQSKALDNHPAMVGYAKYIKGLQYLAGMTNTLDQEVRDFFRNELGEYLPRETNTDYERYRLGEKAYVRKLKKELPRLIKESDSRKEAYQKKLEESANKQLTNEEKKRLVVEKKNLIM